MGGVKVKVRIERLDTPIRRQITYAKRKAGLMKKASELATLCDVELAVLTFSSTGKPSLCVGRKSDLASIVGKMSNMTLQERSYSKCATVRTLQKSYKHFDHEVDPRKFSDNGKERMEVLQSELKQLQQKLVEKCITLSTWMNPEKINDLAQLKAMEKTIMGSLSLLKREKEDLIHRGSLKSLSVSKVHHVNLTPTLKRSGKSTVGSSQPRNLTSLANTNRQNENSCERIESIPLETTKITGSN